tara:strand:+ start:101 stop:682 length:582 start_codon:yes stop_codon:yes gene_type:complete
MNQLLKTIYTIIIGVSSVIFLSNLQSLKKYNTSKLIKYILLAVSGIIATYTIYKSNNYIDKYVLPLLLFLNVTILLYISIEENKTFSFVHILSMIGIVYLLLTFNYTEFEVKNGKLIKPNKKWIYQYILILGLWFISSNFKTGGLRLPKNTFMNNILSCLILIYPLLFPIEEYFLHRIYAISTTYMVINILGV